jgi:hypothetical protein
MLNKPIKIRKFAMMSVALIFWLSGVSLFAQNKQVSTAEPEKKQVPSAQQKVSLSNKGPQVQKQDEATAKRAASEQKRKEAQATEAKKENLAKENAAAVKQSKHVETTSAKAPVNAVQNAQTNNNNAKTGSIQQDWEIKKAKIAADLKAKGASQNDIDKQIAAMEKQMNINNKSNK